MMDRNSVSHRWRKYPDIVFLPQMELRYIIVAKLFLINTGEKIKEDVEN